LARSSPSARHRDPCARGHPFGSAASADGAPPGKAVKIAAALPLSGDETSYGQGTLHGIQLAIEEANATGAAPHIELAIHDDKSSDGGAKEVAEQIATSAAVLVLGPTFSTASLAAGPLYAAANLPALTPTATADSITKNPTTFRVIFTHTEQGEILAIYLSRVLGLTRAAVIVVDNAYGRSLQLGFQIAAGGLEIEAQYFIFQTPTRRSRSHTKSPTIILHPPWFSSPWMATPRAS
jgi:branched-chain amino acid transport system substrate-binding protein